MPRCPDYLTPDDFDKLAQSLNISLTDDGVGALGEIVEYIAMQIINVATQSKGEKVLNQSDIITAAENLGIKIHISNRPEKAVAQAYI